MNRIAKAAVAVATATALTFGGASVASAQSSNLHEMPAQGPSVNGIPLTTPIIGSALAPFWIAFQIWANTSSQNPESGFLDLGAFGTLTW